MTDIDGRAESGTPEDFISELKTIADWWCRFGWGDELARFHGEVDSRNRAVEGADKGVVLATRTLWFFAELARISGETRHRRMADRAYAELTQMFLDRQHEGLFWTVDAEGVPLDRTKKTYAQAFGLYAVCAFHRLAKDSSSRSLAVDLFNLLELRCQDSVQSGFLEAFEQDWTPARDLRLSEVDQHAPKSMNTHLHVLEAYTSCHSLFETERTAAALRRQIELFCSQVVAPGGTSLRMYFDRDWTSLSDTNSHGHNIEASWLLWKACSALSDDSLSERVKPMVVGLADNCLRQSLQANGALIYETFADGRRDDTSIWWVQAEALVGFTNAYELTGCVSYLCAAAQCWRHIRQAHIDPDYGEWWWVAHDGPVAADREYKAGMWKCPYHNGRAMMEMADRLQRLGRISIELAPGESENKPISGMRI